MTQNGGAGLPRIPGPLFSFTLIAVSIRHGYLSDAHRNPSIPAELRLGVRRSGSGFCLLRSSPDVDAVGYGSDRALNREGGSVQSSPKSVPWIVRRFIPKYEWRHVKVIAGVPLLPPCGCSSSGAFFAPTATGGGHFCSSQPDSQVGSLIRCHVGSWH